ncbi:hypothetical protein NEMBOFW57_009980 [Staphylotrichum longicolle]|uniref:Uncharacterized protein n=1 Tax=Staphylotrichum longicolle TaxID=669026 RepID=A0AAD4EQ96_9PEZI|nr:hypothetical protein NEMBOFW57_009980 [Staphylotrichum longicolle]
MQGQTPPPPPLPPPPRKPPTTQIPTPPSVLQAVYASDQEMYPVALSYSRLCAWVEACPDLSICFQNGTAPTGEESAAAAAGVVIVLPLKRVYWEDLLVGRLKEPEIEPGEMFPAWACATPAGSRTFEKLGFLPTGYKELFVASVSQDGTGKQPLEMVCQFPGEQSSPERDFSTGGIVSMSEMAVKHGDLLDLV